MTHALNNHVNMRGAAEGQLLMQTQQVRHVISIVQMYEVDHSAKPVALEADSLLSWRDYQEEMMGIENRIVAPRKNRAHEGLGAAKWVDRRD